MRKVGIQQNLLKEDQYVDDPKKALTRGEILVDHKINLVFPWLFSQQIPNGINVFSGSCDVCNIISRK